MQSTPKALVLALDLAQVPAFARELRQQPLPPDVLDVIRIAADCTQTCEDAARITGQSVASLQQASRLYLQTALFVPDGDSYRALGASPAAGREELRQHFHWLMKWLHPDAGEGWENVFARRVVEAWNDVKDPARRAAYDTELQNARLSRPQRSRRPLGRPPGKGIPLIRSRVPGTRWSLGDYAVAAVVGLSVALAALILATNDMPSDIVRYFALDSGDEVANTPLHAPGALDMSSMGARPPGNPRLEP